MCFRGVVWPACCAALAVHPVAAAAAVVVVVVVSWPRALLRHRAFSYCCLKCDSHQQKWFVTTPWRGGGPLDDGVTCRARHDVL